MRGMIPQNEFENLKNDCNNLKQKAAEVYVCDLTLEAADWSEDGTQTFDGNVSENDFVEVMAQPTNAENVAAVKAAGLIVAWTEGQVLITYTSESAPEGDLSVCVVVHKKVQELTLTLHEGE